MYVADLNKNEYFDYTFVVPDFQPNGEQIVLFKGKLNAPNYLPLALTSSPYAAPTDNYEGTEEHWDLICIRKDKEIPVKVRDPDSPVGV